MLQPTSSTGCYMSSHKREGSRRRSFCDHGMTLLSFQPAVAEAGTAEVGIGEARSRIGAETSAGTSTVAHWADGRKPQEGEALGAFPRLSGIVAEGGD
jgi:hypothetical protein